MPFEYYNNKHKTSYNDNLPVEGGAVGYKHHSDKPVKRIVFPDTVAKYCDFVPANGRYLVSGRRKFLL
jgi:hypothetical protein